jgi:hypothetical protein
MKGFGIFLMVIGLICGVIGLTMDVTVTIPAQNYGFGISTPAMAVNNIGKMDTRRNILIAGGFLARYFATCLSA